MIFKTLDKRQQKIVAPESWETNKVSPINWLCDGPKVPSRPQCKEWGPSGNLVDSLRWADGPENLGKPRQREFAFQTAGDAVASRTRMLVISGALRWFWRLVISARVWGIPTGMGKEPQGNFGGKSTDTQTGWAVSTYSYRFHVKPHSSKGSRCGAQTRVAFVVRRN